MSAAQPPWPPHPALPSPWFDASAAPRAWSADPQPPIVWSVAGQDSGGAAGLSADTRAAAALGVHLCPVTAALTAQNSLGVRAVFAVPPDQLQAQLEALDADLRPRVIKTGLLASVATVETLAERVDALRRSAPCALVVDPVLGASAGGAAFADAALLDAYRRLLLPRASLLTPNRREAALLAGQPADASDVPALASALRALGAQAVCITGGDSGGDSGGDDGQACAAALALDWWDGALSLWQPELGSTRGWLALPRLHGKPLHHHGSGCSFATAAAAALARGFPLPDAALLAKMMVWCALRDGHAAGAGAGPLRPLPGFIDAPAALPLMGFAHDARPDAATLARWGQVLRGQMPAEPFAPGLYAITEQAGQIEALAWSGRFSQIQLRIKAQPGGSEAEIGAAIATALRGMQGQPGCQLWINDHWQLALAQGASALHLGQEDWAALGEADRGRLLRLRAQGELHLGLSSHSLWELCRARSLAPSYVACGPVWPTTTKTMPWLPQGLDNLAWWAALAGRPVVAFGGLLQPAQWQACRAAGAAAACLVRGLDRSG